MELPPAASFPSTSHQEEYVFLLELYNSLNMADKSFLHNWFQDEESTDYCQFTGIKCKRNGFVSTLDLSDFGLTGTLPSSFLPLLQVRRLVLRNNSISGALPTHLPKGLIHYNLSRNQIHGPLLPTATTHNTSLPTNLQRLILSGNLLSGAIPQDLCGQQKLRSLHLSNNPFITGTLPDCLAALQDLQDLRIRNTNLVGPVPEALCPINVFDDGLCNPWDFCMDGYQEVFLEDNVTLSCVPCNGPSNRISSPRCEVLEEVSTIPSDGPSMIPSDGPSMLPSSQPSMIPSDGPSLMPSFKPSASPSSFPSLMREPSSGPSARPSLHQAQLEESNAPSSDPSWTNHPFDASSTPSLFGSSSPSFREHNETFHGVVGGGPSAPQSSESVTRDQGIFLLFPATLLVCCLGLAAALLVFAHRLSPAMQRRRRQRKFWVLPDAQSGDVGTTDSHMNEETSSQSLQCDDTVPEQTVGTSLVPVPAKRPCIVRPGTLSRNPRVRFFLGARSESLSNEVDEESSGSLDPYGSSSIEDQQHAPATKQLDSPMNPSLGLASIFRCPCTINGHESHTIGAVSSQQDCIPLSNNSKSSEGSVTISTITPELTSLNEDTGYDDVSNGINAQGIDATTTIGASPRMIIAEPSADYKHHETPDIPGRQRFQIQPLYSENRPGGLDRRRDPFNTSRVDLNNHGTHREAPPEMWPSLLDSASSLDSTVTGFPLLGIRPPLKGSENEDDFVDSIELYDDVESHPRRQFLEVTEM